MVGERLGIHDQFLGVDELKVQDDGSIRVLERVEGGRYLASVCEGPPLVAAWATGSLPEPPNSPQVGMQNMRTIMPALAKAKPAPLGGEGTTWLAAEVPQQRRETRVVKDSSADEIAREIVAWIKG